MAASQSFVDLRTSSLNAGTHTDDSVWPSFTDIMTVVVMIFLMSLVVILLRNVELVKSEQESTRLAELKASENVELETAISNLEQRIAEIQLQLQAQVLKTQQSDEQLDQTKQQATELMADIQALQLLRDKLNDENTQLAAAKLALEGRIKIVEDEKSSIEELNQRTQLSKLSLEDENQQLIIQLNAVLEEKQLLSSAVSDALAELTMLEEEKQQLDSALSNQQTQLTTLEQEKQAIILQVQELNSASEQTQTDFDALKAVYSLLQNDNRTLFDRISDAEKMIVELEDNLTQASQTIEQKQEQLSVAQSEIQTKTVELVETKAQFTELEEKYLKLVGPARSELDKYVVAVRYRLIGNQTVIDIANPASSAFVQVNTTQMHSVLAELKRQKGKDLYTRVVIPSDSGLSYDQAWKFTQDILTQYDYYYQ